MEPSSRRLGCALARDASERPTYGALAAEFGISESQVSHHLGEVRSELRSVLLETLRQITATEEEFRDEARSIFGLDPDG